MRWPGAPRLSCGQPISSRHARQHIPLEVNRAALPGHPIERPTNALSQPRVCIGNQQMGGAAPTKLSPRATGPPRRARHASSFSLSATSTPTTSRSPNSLTPWATSVALLHKSFPFPQGTGRWVASMSYSGNTLEIHREIS